MVQEGVWGTQEELGDRGRGQDDTGGVRVTQEGVWGT